MIGVAILAVTRTDLNSVEKGDVEYLLQALAKHADRLYLSVPEGYFSPPNDSRHALPSKCSVVELAGLQHRYNHYVNALKLVEQTGSGIEGDVLFCDCTIYGPLGELTDIVAYRALTGSDIVSAFTHHKSKTHPRLRAYDRALEFLESNWLHVAADLACTDHFKNALADAAVSVTHKSLIDVDEAFCKRMSDLGLKAVGYDSIIATTSLWPQMFEPDKLIRGGHPLLHRAVLLLDPLIYEMQSLRGSKIISAIKEATRFDEKRLWRTILAVSELREEATRFEELRIIDNGPRTTEPARQIQLSEGDDPTTDLRCVLVAHVYYADFLTEVIAHFGKMPSGSTLLVSVATAEAEAAVSAKLKKAGIAKCIVRCVAMNRGRDMSSLFITFRDEFLSGKYDLALRLHSKKTPQVATHISDHFRNHLIENLVPDAGFVAGVVDMFRREPNIGMAIPPTIHVGFATLGHAWFSNWQGTRQMADRLNLKVRLDKNTPLAAYGTMFWFRPEAMVRMFSEEWSWDEFNPEPNHVDGGLAHIMERLMGYAVQSEGYRVMQITSKDQIVANYVKLEYKLQLLASHFPSGDIREQVKIARDYFSIGVPLKEQYWNRWTSMRTRIKRNHPKAWALIRPVLSVLRRVLVDAPKRLLWRMGQR